MMLIIMRHGEAKPKEEDPERGLTERGRAQASAVSRALRTFRPPMEELWHSGKRRAAETASILAESLGLTGQGRARPGLDPEDPAAAIAAELWKLEKNLAIVGHLPHLGRLASLLLSGKESPELVDLPAAGALCLERSESLWKVRWFLTPQTCSA